MPPCRVAVRLIVTISLIVMLQASRARAASGEEDNQRAESVRGIYLYSEHPENSTNMAELLQALPAPGVDGLTMLVGWQAIEPHNQQFDWTLFDQLIGAAASSGRKVDLAIRAGQDTPNWLFVPVSNGGPGATKLKFQVSPLEGDISGSCNEVDVAAPWDTAFLSEWDFMLATVSQHLKDIGAYERVVAVRLTGINRTTGELRLPAEILTTPCVTNSVETWLAAGYKPSLLLRAWDAITDSFQHYFPDKVFTLPIIPSASGNGDREYPFPAIDENGCPFQPPWPIDMSDPNYFPTSCIDTNSIPGAFPPVPDQNALLIALASQKFPGRLIVAYQNLDLRFPAQPYVVYAAKMWYTKPAFQTNDYIGPFEQAACSTAQNFQNPCANWAAYLGLLEIGIYPCTTNTSLCARRFLQSQYIEVLAPDVISFPPAIFVAHIQLHLGP